MAALRGCGLMVLVVMAAALKGDDLHQTVAEMKSSERSEYTKSHKKFRFFDADNSGFLSKEEFEAGLKKLGYKTNSKKLDYIMSELDMDNDGRVEFVEFMRPTAKKYKEERELEKGADTDRAMEHFDKNFDGRISSEEFYLGLSHLKRLDNIRKDDYKDFFVNYADLDGDGYLTYEELDSIDPALL
ncbi:hypothetical protein GUITHDRAFT_164139 [Guillardia theta CCMP2712]|uniref:EF-hand domain-containing protein n=1 Tax=Guillardia theta (strain CCMP2712) TaxID=905079 RepID=L1J2K6_GUITC|nr:hypothetical protein GUITHDRAFT_164139 [Guillardia theta CCMP2712]EKX42310.1 hypothetical protein GUITHDRAFT_164139 [Guillardia theta CCMP2712]|eukprot:XP_005829290.1 hypothetical protein GUITHDRAFT_164139 [Guillardia theta CCMP2712]